MKKSIILSILLIPIYFFGQSSIKKANNHFSNFSYHKVIEKLEGNVNLTTDVQRKLAESYKLVGNHAAAEIAYAKLVNATDRTPNDVYAYAQILKMNAKYLEAQQQMDVYASLNNKDSRVLLNKQNKNYTIDLLKNKGQFDVKNLAANSPEQDFGVTYFKDQLVYTSSKHEINAAYRRWNGNNLPFLDLYIGKPDTNGEITNTKKFNTLNKKYHEGPASFSKDGNYVIYTQDNYKKKSKDGTTNLEMMISAFENGKWSIKTAFPLNNEEYSVGHPALSADGKTLYFASDMPGGKGGVDIYRAVKDTNGNWINITNLGDKINTEGNEMFPFIHESGLFFFSSDGRPGLGGLDVFVTEIKNNRIGKVLNAGNPVNGPKDDFSMVLNSAKTKGYFASNRDGGKGDDDVYSYNFLKPFQFGKLIKGIAKDEKGNILANVSVNLFDAKGKLIQTITTNATGNYSFDIENPEAYRLSGKSSNYFEANNKVNVSDDADVIVSNLILEKDPGLSLVAIITDAKTQQALSDVKITITQKDNTPFDTYLTQVVGNYRKALPTNKIGDKLVYKLKLEKPGYLTKDVDFTYTITKAGDINIHEALNLTLSKLEIGGDLAKMIDIKPIYFDLGKYTIRKDATLELDKIVKIMNEYPNMVIELGSHTDCRATAVFNEKLSDNRAKASAEYIKKSISKTERITGKGYGESKLKNGCACEGTVKSTCSEEEHQQNRRTEFIILSVE
jgi:outer membrane protein OmpA-like peptidoglycan-associated protein